LSQMCLLHLHLSSLLLCLITIPLCCAYKQHIWAILAAGTE